MRIVVEDTCHNCKGMGWVESKATGVRTCPVCNGRRVSQQTISLENFARLFTWGQDYDDAAMRRERAPKNVLRVAENEGGDT